MDCATYIMCEGIVIEILRRLPAKSLIRFMAVCRLWKTIITSPQFRLHPKRPSKLLVHTDRGCYSLVEEEKRKLIMFETDFLFKHCSGAYATFIGSDNGLVCIRITNTTTADERYYYRGGHDRVIIWNPCIRKHVVGITDVVGDGITYYTEGASGFGGTASGGDYKYVHVRIEGESFKRVVCIYSLKAGTWRRKYLDDDDSNDITRGVHFRGTCALLRGRLHWIGISTYKQIYSFELEDEVFENNIIMLPESKSIQSCFDTKVTVIRESLAVIATDDTHRHPRAVCVWVMEEYGDDNSWIKLCSIAPQGFDYWVERNMVHLMKDGELLLGLQHRNEYPHEPKLVTYNPKTMKTCDVVGGGSFPLFTEQVCGFSYKESLVLFGMIIMLPLIIRFSTRSAWFPLAALFPGFFVLVLAEL